MKILQFTFSLTSGGAEKFTIDLANKLAETNEVYLCVVLSEKYKKHTFFKDQLNENVNYINLNCSKGINIKTFFSIFKLIKKISPNVIHFHLNTILYFYLPSLIYRNKIRFIHTLHNVAPKTIRFRWQKKINMIFYKNNIIRAVAISKECLESFIGFYGHEKITLIENGVAQTKSTPELYNVKREVDEIKNKVSDKVFIHVATYEKQKNQKLLIEVFNRLIDKKIGVILIVLGKYFDSKQAEELRKNAKRGIHFLGTRKNITDYLFNSDAFVLSSLWEGLPISLLEALSSGTIPVCTPAGGIPDVIKDESIGYLSEDFTGDGLYNAITKCLTNMDTFDKLNLKKYFDENFSIEICAKKYKDVYKF